MYESRSDPDLTLIHIYTVKALVMEPARLFKATKAEEPSQANELTYILSGGFSCGPTTQQPGKWLVWGVRGSVRDEGNKKREIQTKTKTLVNLQSSVYKLGKINNRPRKRLKEAVHTFCKRQRKKAALSAISWVLPDSYQTSQSAKSESCREARLPLTPLFGGSRGWAGGGTGDRQNKQQRSFLIQSAMCRVC